MLKGQSIIGKKVLSRMDGQRIDSVRDIVISKDHTRVVALILDEGGIFSSGMAVAMENVVSFGNDAVVITDSKAVIRVDHFPAVKEIMDDRDSLVGKKVFTESGNQMGQIDDVYFDESTGSITSLEVVGKIVPTVKNGAAQLIRDDIVSIGPDAVMINMAGAGKLEAQVGGTPIPKDSSGTPAALPGIDNGPTNLQTGTGIPDFTFDSAMPGTSDSLTQEPPTATLPSFGAEGSVSDPTAVSDDDTPGTTARVKDPTSDRT